MDLAGLMRDFLEQATYLEMTTASRVTSSLRTRLARLARPMCTKFVQLSGLQASEEFDVPMLLLCITTTLSPSYVLKESRWACCRSDGPVVEGWVAFKGYPLLGRAKPLRPEDKLKSIVARLHCHLSPALGDQKKQAMRAELTQAIATTRRLGSVPRCGGPSGSKIKKL